MERKKITFLAIGSRGDLNPSCALARELKERGYDVCIATHQNFKSYVLEQRINYAAIAGNYQEILNTEIGLDLLAGKGKLRLINDKLFNEQLIDAYNSCKDSDAIIVFPLSLWGYHIAEKLNVPCICSSYVPITPTKDFPFLKFGNQKTRNFLLRHLNYFSYLVVEFLSWQADRKVINQFRQQVLKLAPVPFLGNRYRYNAPSKFKIKEISILYQFSSQVIPLPSDWNQPNLYITGNWFIEEEEEYRPSSDLFNFLKDKEKPIYIGFGSMVMRNPQQIAELLIEAINATKQRAIIASSWSNLEQFIDREKNPHIFVSSDYIPFNWLFPQTKLLIHHGGSGTTALGLKAGIPQILTPFFADQPAWAEKLVNLGVSSDFIPFKKLSSQELTTAIKSTINNPSIYDKAQKIKNLIERENGVKVAADKINYILNSFNN
jgi:UDP:flavonoid glycosyltransferase YjiC (YdhE family)